MTKVLFPFSQTFLDYPDNENQAILIYMTGCDNSCKGCHNIQFKNPNVDNSVEFSIEEIISNIEKLSKRIQSNKVVLSGGDPLSKYNIETTKILLKCKEFDYCVYTGHDIEYVKKNEVSGFKFVKCGNYLEEFKQESSKTDDYIKFASTNQELYNEEYKKISLNGVYYFKGEF